MQPKAADGSTPHPLSLERIVRRYLEKKLCLFTAGSVSVKLPNGKRISHRGPERGPTAVINVKHWALLRKLLLEGEIGLARAYVDGDWSTPDLAAVLEYGLQNETSVSAAMRGFGVGHFANRINHHRNANTRRGSRRNIAAHYDLGNRFYELWLDSSMTYSSAIFADAGEALEAAQERKLLRAIELLDIKGGERVLEIGCGWGSLAQRIAHSGASHVTGISLSHEQVEYARAALLGTPHRDAIDFQLRDYRSISERYDRIVSIEMFEAVGERYWPMFFNQLNTCLSANGTALLQIITIDDDLFASYRVRPDFIQQYIFPGGMLPTRAHVEHHARRAGFRIEQYEPFGPSYALTLEDWQRRFNAAWSDIEKLGFDDRFRRMWNYYLTYCAVGFRHGSIDVGMFKLRRI
jgi:cyclopropane-fatty-acyl-phospholipid synthase